SAALDARMAPGWNLLPIPAAQSTAALADVSIGSPDYSDPYVDPTFDTEWVPSVPVPMDLGMGNPPDPTLPIEDGSCFWYRLEFVVPSEWAAQSPGRDLILSGYTFEKEDWAYFNGMAIGHTRDGRDRRYRIPREVVRIGATNVLAIKGLQTHGSA